MNQIHTLGEQLHRGQRWALGIGVLATVVCLVGARSSPEQFFRSYLLGYLFWVSIALGSLAIVMLHHLVGGAWGVVIRRLLEAATRTLPLLALLFLPLLAGLDSLYVWARPEMVAADPVLQHKSNYLSISFFALRTAFYFVAWMALAYLLNKSSAEQDRTGDPHLIRRLQIVSGPGLILYVLTVTFASVDWVMSLEPHWYSTVFGLLLIMGQALAGLAFVIPVLMLLSHRKPLSAVLEPSHFHDLGNLLLAFVMLWAYIAFAQFLIIWSGNLPEEIPWYLHRMGHGWQWIGLVLVVFHFAIPFVLLLSRGTKRKARTLAGVAAGVFLLRLVDLFWLIAPTFHGTTVQVHWMDGAVPVALGGFWVSTFLWQLKARPLLPLQDPRLKEFGEQLAPGA